MEFVRSQQSKTEHKAISLSPNLGLYTKMWTIQHETSYSFGTENEFSWFYLDN